MQSSNAVLVCAFIAGLAMFYFLSEPFLRRVAEEEVLTRARIMRGSAAGVRKYTAEEIAPLLTGRMTVKFHPQTVAAYAATKNFGVLREQFPDYRYREVALNPTNPASRASVVVVLSPRSVASENVLDEVGFAIDSSKSVIPVLIEACDIPIRLSRLQRVDFTGDYAAALDRCRMVLGGIDPELVQRAEAELTAYLGPLASKLVEVDLMVSRNAADLYQKLASHILNPVKRAAFLKNAPTENGARRPAAPGRQPVSATPAAVFSQPLLEAVTLEVIKILGPIAVHLVKQASRQATDAEDLCERVASHVANVQEREKLLKRLRAL